MTQEVQPLTWSKRTNIEEHREFFSKINEIIDNLAPTVDEAEAAIAQATAAIANANAAIATANAASAAASAAASQAQTAASTVAGYDTRLTAAEGDIDAAEGDIAALQSRMGTAEGNITALQGVQADYVKKAGAAQTVTSQIMVPTTATGLRDTQIANGTRIQNDLAAYEPMIRNTGNQTKAGTLTLINQPIMALGGIRGRLPAMTDYLHFGTIQSNADANFTVPAIIFERGGLVIGDIGITVSGGTVTAVTFTGKAIVGTAIKIFVGAAMSDDGVKLYCHSDSVNRYFIANILGAMSGNGYGQGVAPALEIVNSTPAGYVEAAFIEA